MNQIYNNGLSMSNKFHHFIALIAIKWPVKKRVGKPEKRSKAIRKRKNLLWALDEVCLSIQRAIATATTRGQCMMASTSRTLNPTSFTRRCKRYGPQFLERIILIDFVESLEDVPFFSDQNIPHLIFLPANGLTP